MELPIEISLLGGIEIRRGGRKVHLPARSLQLLAYLLIKPGPHHREQIAAELWPGANKKNARKYLRNTVWKIRTSLGHDIIPKDEDEPLAINRALVKLDLAQLELRHPQGASIDEIAVRLEAFRGELLPGFYEEWVLPERARIAGTAERLFKIITEKCLAEGRHEDARQWSDKWIYRLGPSEPAYRALMQAYAALADVSGLSAAYQRCKDDLRHLGVDPSHETRNLYHSLINGQGRAAEAPTPSKTHLSKDPPRPDRRPWTSVGWAGIALVLLIGAFLYSLQHPQRIDETEARASESPATPPALTQATEGLATPPALTQASESLATLTGTCPLGNVATLSAEPAEGLEEYAGSQVMPNGQGQIAMITGNGSETSAIRVEGLYVTGTTWAPNGYLLIIADPRGDISFRGGGDFYVIDTAGTVIAQLTFCSDEIAKGTPALSPSGDEILFSDGNGVSILSLQDGRVETIVPHDQFQWTFSANWSPDGQHIAYMEVRPPCDECNNTVRVVIVNRDGSNRRVLYETHGGPDETLQVEVDSIGFSPDGEYVGFMEHGSHKVRVSGGDVLRTNELVWAWLPTYFRYDPGP